MKYILIKLIKFYQKVPGSFHDNCKYIPTCSNYGIEAIEKHGAFKGLILTIYRVLRCNPFSKGGIDLVPERKKKMKKSKLLILVILLFISTGCLKEDSFEDISIYTTVYPIEYITNYLYEEHSTIYSIYPDGVDILTYEISEKQIKDYSDSSLYIFNGLALSQENVLKMVNYNSNLKIIDATNTMEYKYDLLELWIDPSNFLMMCKNVKNGLQEYIDTKYLDDEVEQKYEELKLSISNIDASLKLLSESIDNNTIVTDSNALLFLEKYGFNVISLDSDTITDKVISQAIIFLESANYKYIYVTKNDNISDDVNKVLNQTEASILVYNTIDNITPEQRNDKVDYIYLLKENVDLLKQSLYN